MVFLRCILFALCTIFYQVQGTLTIELDNPELFFTTYNEEAEKVCTQLKMAQWTYATNITNHNKAQMILAQKETAQFEKLWWLRTFTMVHNPKSDLNTSLKRDLHFILENYKASLPLAQYNEIYHLIAEMKDIYNNLDLCIGDDAQNCTNFHLNPDLVRIMSQVRDPNQLRHLWTRIHNKIGRQMKNRYMRYVQLANDAAHSAGFKDAGEAMRKRYITVPEYERTWSVIEPLYRQLFTYVRRRLYKKYGPDTVRINGPLQAHLLGNLWAQDWSGLYSDLLVPYPEHQQLIGQELLRHSYTPLKLFLLAEELFTSLGLKPMPPEFWRESLFERPTNRTVVQCTSSAWDFCNRIDFRVKQCTEVSFEYLVSTHRQMAHIQYYLQYADQQFVHRQGGNPAFHHSFANLVETLCTNPIHWHNLGLIQTISYEQSMNFLMLLALKKIAFAPFAFLLEKWRFSVFQEGVTDLNAKWWRMRLHYQGIVPPVARNEYHFDAASKRHIAADLPYLKYYLALLLEFQILEAVCQAAGHQGALHTCDFYRSRQAGHVLHDFLHLGRSKPWPIILRQLTKGHIDHIKAEALIKYFKPLEEWLKAQNQNETLIGWRANFSELARFQDIPNLGKKHVVSAFNLLVLIWIYLLCILH